ncbi:MAG: hypothetical protein ACRDO4_10185 [Nocardioides sp.]
MLFILISMLVIVVVAGLVVTFVAFPHRGEDIPGAAWLGDGMAKAVDALPTLEPEPYDDAGHRPEHARSLVGDDESDESR